MGKIWKNLQAPKGKNNPKAVIFKLHEYTDASIVNPWSSGSSSSNLFKMGIQFSIKMY